MIICTNDPFSLVITFFATFIYFCTEEYTFYLLYCSNNQFYWFYTFKLFYFPLALKKVSVFVSYLFLLKAVVKKRREQNQTLELPEDLLIWNYIIMNIIIKYFKINCDVKLIVEFCVILINFCKKLHYLGEGEKLI